MKALAPLLLFALLTTIVAWPVVSQLDSLIIGDDQDAYLNPWADWWTLRALTEPQTSFWYTDYLFYPRGTDLHFHSFSHLTTIVSLSLRPLFGSIGAYNVTILLHLVLAGLAMFHFARYLTDSALAGLLAGIVFAFNSHNILQTSHPVLVSVWPLPWSALFLLQAIDRRDNRRALIAAGFVFLAALCSTLMLILTGLWLLFILFFALLTGRLTRDSQRQIILFGLASAVLAALPVLPLLEEALLGANRDFVVTGVENLPADVLAPVQPYWFGLLPRSLHFGIVPLLLLGASFFRLRQTWPWLLFLLAVYLFAIGPTPVVAEEELSVNLVWSNAIRPLLRHTHRLNVLMSAGLAGLVAYGWVVVAARLQRVPLLYWLIALLLAGSIYIEYSHSRFPRRSAAVSPFYTEYLEAVPDDVALAILPTGRQQDKLYMYFQTLHGHKMTNGVVSRHDDEVFNFIRNNALLHAGAVNLSPTPFPEDGGSALSELAEAGVGFLVLDKASFEQQELDWQRWRALLPGEPVYEDDLVVVFSTSAE